MYSFIHGNPAGAFNYSQMSRLNRLSRAANSILLPRDSGALIDITSGTFSQTFAPASVLGAGWWCYVRNSGTGLVTLAPTETINGATSCVLGAGTLIVQCNGATFTTVFVPPGVVVSSRSSDTPLAQSDFGALIDITTSFTQTFVAAATLRNGWWCYIRNSTQATLSSATLDPNASELIDGQTSGLLYAGTTLLVVCTGTALS